ncbi:hypothetical protein R1sor_002070 [Riccia sorocarpa]|uniref:Uncharacterized protein n=1 Tax=Riccia sorocarpa TaxID=122646 RepID=A0ABD3GXR0_9MARC
MLEKGLIERILCTMKFIADDIGIFLQASRENFQGLLQVLATHEAASRTKVQKSLVIPLGKLKVPEWIHDFRCEIVVPGQPLRYVGVLTGIAVSEVANVEDMQQDLELDKH